MKRGIFFVLEIIILIFFASASQTNSSSYKADIIISEGGTNSSSSSYQTDTSIGIISGNLNSSSFKQSLGFFFCIPSTCAKLGYNCGSWSDGCGGTINCGSCSSGYSCSAGICAGTVTSTSGGGGAGGTGAVAQETIFTIDKTLIKTLINQGETSRETIEIQNNLNSTVNFQVSSSLKKFMVISEESFSIAPKSSKTIFVDIFARQDEIPDAYTGKITITGNGVTEIINLILEVKERKPYFDTAVSILTKEISAGGNAKANFKISNLGNLNNMDISIYYAIQNFDGKIISFKEESIAINKELSLTRTLNIPQDTPVGDYVFYLKASYNNITASSMETFKVVEQTAPPLFLILLISCIILILSVLIFVIILYRKFHSHLEEREIKYLEKKPTAVQISIKSPSQKIGLIQKIKKIIKKLNKKREEKKILKEIEKQKRIAEKKRLQTSLENKRKREEILKQKTKVQPEKQIRKEVKPIAEKIEISKPAEVKEKIESIKPTFDEKEELKRKKIEKKYRNQMLNQLKKSKKIK